MEGLRPFTLVTKSRASRKRAPQAPSIKERGGSTSLFYFSSIYRGEGAGTRGKALTPKVVTEEID